MRAVWKYGVPVDDASHIVNIPGGARTPLHVACQDGPDTVQAWFLVEDEEPAESVRLRVFGTGQPIPDGAAWVGTALAAEGRLVWHLFQLVCPECNDTGIIRLGTDERGDNLACLRCDLEGGAT